MIAHHIPARRSPSLTLTTVGMMSRCAALLALLCAAAGSAQAQVPGDPYNYSRSSSFTYYDATAGSKNGLLASETVEPGNPQLCVTTAYAYDAYRNKSVATTSSCA